MTGRFFIRPPWMPCFLALISLITAVGSAESFCVRNDTGTAIMIEAIDDSATFSHELANNKKVCCPPKDQACALGKDKVSLTISTAKGEASCDIAVEPKGNVNVTGKPDQIKCKANKAGSTMDWASG